MQTSKNVMLRRLGKVLAFVAAAILLDVLLSLALQPYGGTTEIVWHDYRNRADDPIDTLIVGSSYSSYGVNVPALDEPLGSYSFNLSTPAQAIHSSAAALRTASDEHHIKRAIVCLRTSTLQYHPWYNAQVTFLEAKSLGEGPLDVLRNVSDVATYETNFDNSRSLGWMFPWVYNPLIPLDWEHIAGNVSRRLASSDPAADTAHLGKDYEYCERGQNAYHTTMNFQSFDVEGEEFELPERLPLLDTPMSELASLLDECDTRGIETYVVIMPIAPFANLAAQSAAYRSEMMDIEALVEDHGATYIDFNLSKADFYRPRSDEFIDTTHLNLDGSIRFSETLGTYLRKIEDAEDVAPLFYTYDEWDDYIASFDKLEACYFTSHTETTGVSLHAVSIAQRGVPVEYRYEMKNKQKGSKYEIVRDFGRNPFFVLPVEGEGSCIVRVTTRIVGSTSPEDSRTFHRTITY